MRLGIPGEVGLFARVAAYGLFIALVYWLVAYEFAGTVLLAGFGLATGVVAALLAMGRRAGKGQAARATEPVSPLELLVAAETPPRETPPRLQNEGPFGDEVTRIPGPSAAPFTLGLGLAIAILGLVFGAWLLVAGGIVVVFAAWQWIAEVMGEHRAMR